MGKSFVFEVWGYNYGICVISYGLVKKIMIVFMVICIWWSFNGGKNLNLVVVCFLYWRMYMDLIGIIEDNSVSFVGYFFVICELILIY